jgi:hypothetical protein
LIETIFLNHYHKGLTKISFERKEIEEAASKLKIKLPKNVGDVIYSFRYRAQLPESILSKAAGGFQWIIRPAGRSKYQFVMVKESIIAPSEMMAETKIPDATPGIIAHHALTDEQAVLAKIRYNRLIDIFTGIACYSLQSHLRTAIKELGQVETDEIYVGLDKKGVQYVLPVQAKSKRDRIGVIQIEQDIAMCALKFPELICRPIAAQSMGSDLIALFEFEQNKDDVKIASERHYRLVKARDVSAEELRQYQQRF